MQAEIDPPAVPPRPTSPVARALLFFAVIAAGQIALGTLAQLTARAAGLAWSEIFVMLWPALAWAAATNLDPSRALGLAKRPTLGQLGAGLGAGLASFFAAGALMALSSQLFPPDWVARFDTSRLFAGSLGERVALGAVASLLAPVCEETAFRGFIQRHLLARLRPAGALLVTALLFSALHGDPVGFFARVELGLVFGWLAWRTGSLWPGVLAHAANNAVGSLLLILEGPAAPHDPGQLDAKSAVLTLAIGGAATLAFLAPLARRPPAPAALEPADPERAVRFGAGRVPGWLWNYGALGLAMFAGLVALAFLRR